MVYRYKKLHRYKRKRSIFRNRFFWLGILFLVAGGGIFHFLFFSGIFQIEKIIITGENKVSKEDIESLVPQKNIFLIDTKKIRRDILSNFPQIAEVEIHRGFPDALNILVIERVAVALWCEGEHCFLVDNEGIIFDKALAETDLIKIVGAKEVIQKEKITQILKIQAKLKEALDILITKTLLASDERLDAKTAEGWEIYFNLKGDLDWQIQELGLVLEKQITPEKRKNLEYIDLRFSRVFYK